MIRVFKSPTSKNVFISGVTFGSADDFDFQRNGDLFSISRLNTSILEVSNLHFSEFADVNGNSFVNANLLENHLQDTMSDFEVPDFKSTDITLVGNSELVTSIPYEKFLNGYVNVSSGEIEIQSTGTIDVENTSTNDANVTNDNFTDLTYNNSSTGTVNKPLPGIAVDPDLDVNFVRVYWWDNRYTASKFRIQSTVDGGTSWQDESSNFDSTGVVNSSQNPMDINVSGNKGGYRVFCEQGNDNNYVVISELEAFQSLGTEQRNIFSSDFNIFITNSNGFVKLKNNSAKDYELELNHF